MTLDELLPKTLVEPRPYQRRVIKNVMKHYTEGLTSLLIESPTGSGKTIMALTIARLMQEKFNINIGWVSQRRFLLEQAEKENEAKGINADIEFISMFDKTPPTVDMLIVDEAQHDACNSCANIHNLVQPKYILGMTATPFRTDRAKLCFDKIIKDAGIKALIEQGYLSQYHHYTIDDEWSPEYLAELFIKEKSRWGKSIVFFHTVKACVKFKELIIKEGVTCEVVTGNTDKEKQIENFRKGSLDCLVNCLVLTEGFDCPSLKTVFCRPSCKGVTMQMAGRAFRKFPDIAYKNIVQCKKTKWPFLKTVLPKVQYIREKNEWRTIGANNNTKVASRNVVKTLARINVKLPKILERK